MNSILIKIMAIIAGIILLISIGGNVYFAFRTHSLASQVDSLTTANKTLTENYKACQSSINKQNQDILDAQKSAQDKQDALNNLGKQLTDQQTKNQQLVNQLSKQVAPKTCDAAKAYLKNGLGQYSW